MKNSTNNPNEDLQKYGIQIHKTSKGDFLIILKSKIKPLVEALQTFDETKDAYMFPLNITND